jgi:hypothetical protein
MVLDGMRAVPALHLRLGIIYEGSQLALVPEVHPVHQAPPDVPGSLDPWHRLQDDSDKHQGPLGILYVGDWQADNPPPPPLPGCVSLLDTSSQVTVIVLMGSVSVDRLKELVGRHRLGAGPVSPRVFAKDRALHDVLWTCRVVRWKGRDKLWVPSGLGMGL